MMKLSRIQQNALRLCIKMADNHEIISAKTFGLQWCNGRSATLDGKCNTARLMLTKLSEYGYLEKVELSYLNKNYVVLNTESGKEYIPPIKS